MAYIRTLLATIAAPARVFKITTGGRSFRVQAAGVFISNVGDLGIGRDANIGLLNDGCFDLHIINPVKINDYVALSRRYGGGCIEKNTADTILKVREAVVEVVPRLGILSSFQLFVNQAKVLLSGKRVLPGQRGEELPCMIDGDACGVTPMRVTVMPGVVQVLVPPEKKQAMTPGLKLSAAHDTQDIYQLPAASGQ